MGRTAQDVVRHLRQVIEAHRVALQETRSKPSKSSRNNLTKASQDLRDEVEWFGSVEWSEGFREWLNVDNMVNQAQGALKESDQVRAQGTKGKRSDGQAKTSGAEKTKGKNAAPASQRTTPSRVTKTESRGSKGSKDETEAEDATDKRQKEKRKTPEEEKESYYRALHQLALSRGIRAEVTPKTRKVAPTHVTKTESGTRKGAPLPPVEEKEEEESSEEEKGGKRGIPGEEKTKRKMAEVTPKTRKVAPTHATETESRTRKGAPLPPVEEEEEEESSEKTKGKNAAPASQRTTPSRVTKDETEAEDAT